MITLSYILFWLYVILLAVGVVLGSAASWGGYQLFRGDAGQIDMSTVFALIVVGVGTALASLILAITVVPHMWHSLQSL